MIITNNKVVSINYLLKDELGNVLQGNDGFTPEEYLHGAENILPGLERALEGLQQDQVIDVVIYPEEAYGPREVSLIIQVYNEDLEDPAAINEGEYIQLFDGTEAIVVEKNDDHIIVDANHPLAGQTLYYTVKISGIRDATEEEIINGEPSAPVVKSCGPAGCC
jgi:FKBP-type peptidyl-prolyl cis-trans isomerase SlyD